jgi:outer membrane protein
MRLRSFVLAGFALFTIPLALDAQTPRIAYIDSQAILMEAPGASEAQMEFQRQIEEYQREIQRMGEDLEELINRYQQQQGALSQQAREGREEEIRQREMDYHQRVEAMELQIDRRREELVGPILDRMSDAIEEIRAEGEYAMIFDVASRSIIAADPALDLTDQVIQRLRAAAGSDN